VIMVRSVEKTNARVESSSARADASGVTPSNRGHAGRETSIRLPGVQVGRDLGTEVDDLKLGLDPRHAAPLSLWIHG
jgi:hypothetical protein